MVSFHTLVILAWTMPYSQPSVRGSPPHDALIPYPRDPDPKGRAPSNLALDCNRAPEELEQAPHDMQSQPAAAIWACRRAIDLAKRLEMSAWASRGMPIPVSVTLTTTPWCWACAPTVMPPSVVNFTALLMRFLMTTFSFAGSV